MKLTKVQRDMLVDAIIRKVEDRIDAPTVTNRWVYDLAVRMTEDRLALSERAAWRQGYMKGGQVAMQAMLSKLRKATGWDARREVMGKVTDELLKTRLGR